MAGGKDKKNVIRFRVSLFFVGNLLECIEPFATFATDMDSARTLSEIAFSPSGGSLRSEPLGRRPQGKAMTRDVLDNIYIIAKFCLNISIMKKFIALFLGLIGGACTCFANADELDFEKMWLAEFVRDEATFQNQEIRMPRSSFGTPLTLRMQLNEILGELTYTKATMVQSYSKGMEIYTYESPSDVLDKDPVLLSYDKMDNQLGRKQWEINTSFYLEYYDKDFRRGFIVVHCRPRGYLNKSIYTRTSVMVFRRDAQDDLQSHESESAPVVFSYLTVFDVKDMTEELAEYKMIYDMTMSLSEQNVELGEIEEECMNGIREKLDISYSLGYGKWLFDNERFYDSYIHLIPVFDVVKNLVKPDSEDFHDLLFDLGHKIGLSMWNLGCYDAADYYLELAAYGADSCKFDYNAFIKSGHEVIVNELQQDKMCDITVGDVLSTLFDVVQCNVREAVYTKDGKLQKLKTNQDVWNFDLQSLCSSVTNSMTIAYSRSHYDNNTNTKDKSSLCYENNIIITTTRADDVRWRVNVMIPNFRLHDYKQGGSKYNVPVSMSFIIGKDKLKEFKLKGFDDYVNAFEYGRGLSAEGRIVETLISLTRLHKNIVRTIEDGYDTSIQRILHSAILYNIGYAYADLEMTTKGISYYRQSVELNPISDNKSEYIVLLSNNKDLRTLDIVRNELENSRDNDEDYNLLLNRRLAYMLIEYDMFDEAEAVLKELLNNPKTSQFASSELEYVKMLREQK